MDKMEGVELIEPTDFFNVLNQGMKYPLLSDPCYLLLFDVRNLDQFLDDHIITAKLVKKDEDGNFQIPNDAELETNRNVVVYDETTASLPAQSDSPAAMYAKMLWDNGSKYKVRVIKGGYQTFSALYPFLRTQEMMFTPQQMDSIFTYPIEVIPSFLYVGNRSQSQSGRVNKDLKIKAHVNVSTKEDNLFSGRLEIAGKNDKIVPALLNISVEDKKGEDLLSSFKDACKFIESHKTEDGKSILITSDLGISRSVAVALAYLMQNKKWLLEVAWDHMKKCKRNMCPNRSFVEQLISWEEQLFGEKKTDVHSLET